MHPATTRHLTTLGITGAALALALGTALPALADSPNGHGNGNPPSSPPGQAKQTASPSPSTSPAATPTPSPTHVPPGQAKKPTGGTKTNSGKAKGNGHSRGHGHGNPTNTNPGKGNNGAGSGHNPPGNNGTVKIHSLAGDTSHHNVAHPGCSFVVDFWGFDQDQTLTVSFTGQAPTGAGVPVTFTAPDGTSVTSPDPAGGGNDPDGELVFTPTASELSVLGAPAHQGYHVRLTVATGQGGGKKLKVFWISGCAPTPTATTADTAPTTGAVLPTEMPTPSTDTPQVRAGSLTAAHQSPVRAMPQLQSSRLNQASRPISSLPFTGANLSTLIVSGGLALLAGIFLRAAVRRRRGIG